LYERSSQFLASSAFPARFNRFLDDRTTDSLAWTSERSVLSARLRRRLTKDHNVLARQSGNQTIEHEAFRLDFYSLVVLVAVILSWIPVDRRNPLVTVTRALTEPVLAPIRTVLPPMGGLDLSPMALLLGLQILKGLLV
jgi:uncharacterized protein YggT (Ycf19 family)